MVSDKVFAWTMLVVNALFIWMFWVSSNYQLDERMRMSSQIYKQQAIIEQLLEEADHEPT